jgi:hypothetical protein
MRKFFYYIAFTVLIFSLGINLDVLAQNQSNKNTGQNNQVAPEEYRLYQNFPNPFNPATIINYKITQKGYVTLNVYNLVGQMVATLVSEYQEPGTYTKRFEAADLTAGVYLYKLQVNNFSSVKRMTLIK